MDKYNKLRNTLDGYRWVDLIDLSIYSHERLKEALKGHQKVLEEFDMSISDCEVSKIKEICYERLVKLTVQLQGKSDALVLSDEELKVIKNVTRPSWLDNPATLQKYIKANMQFDIKSPSAIIKKEWERCKADSEIVGERHDKVRSFVRSYLVNTCERRREALEECQRLYENEFAVKLEQIKNSLRAVIRELETKINYRREQLRRLSKIREIPTLETMEEELANLNCEMSDRTTKFYVHRILEKASEVRSGSGGVNECFAMYKTLHERSLKACEMMYERLMTYLTHLDDIKMVLLEISRYSEEERARFDVSLVTGMASACVQELSKVVDTAFEITSERFSLSTPSTEDIEEAVISFQSISSEIRKYKEGSDSGTKKHTEIEHEEYESEEMLSTMSDNL
jgi:hypothetical protein